MKISVRNIGIFIVGIVTLSICIVFQGYFVGDYNNSKLTKDKNMVTNYYESQITINDDNSYTVNEKINVNFLSPRHGIYRYIPYVGNVNKQKNNGIFDKIPYKSKVDVLNSNEKIYSIDNKNGNKCITFGDEDIEITGVKEYLLNYKITPKTQGGFKDIYYNIFPSFWQNDIPKGSKFSIKFPKKIQDEDLIFYYGKYGESKDGKKILNLSWNDNTLNGILIEDLPMGNGLTLYSKVKEGYFSKLNVIGNEIYVYICLVIFMTLLTAALYIKDGRDKKIIPIVQFYPPKGIDSAAAGYLIDGYTDTNDIISLFIYLADKGYIKFKKIGKDDLEIIKNKELTLEVPQYIETVFQGIFNDSNKGKVKLSSLKYKFSPSLNKAISELKSEYTDEIYTKKSSRNRVLASLFAVLALSGFIVIDCMCSYSNSNFYLLYILSQILYLAGILILCNSYDSRYVMKFFRKIFNYFLGSVFLLLGILSTAVIYLTKVRLNYSFTWNISLYSMIISSIIISIFTVLMRKRCEENIKLMGTLIGFKDFIEKAELDRIKTFAEENPKWFYNVLPYAYVFGLSKVWIKKFEKVSVPSPEWYEGYDNSYSFYAYTSMMMDDLKKTEAICRSVEPSSSSSSNGGFGSGSSGGGFSGGGFGGGGGGSW